MKKRIFTLMLIIILLMVNCGSAFAAYNPPSEINEDSVFDSITITFSTYKTAAFSAYTNDIVSYIKVVACWLQKKVDGSWVYYCVLPAPSVETNNTIGYESYMNYSSYVPSDGNAYRIGARFVADGHYVTRYSNQRTF